MEVYEAKNAGFCFGVSRAVETCEKMLEKGEPFYTVGEIIHNETVLEDFAARGVKIIDDGLELSGLKPGIAVIRAHGAAPEVCSKLRDHGFTVEDATCPFVKKIHRLAEEYSDKGYHIILVGKKTHPEVKGICGYVRGGIDVVSDESDIDDIFPIKNKQILVVSQTTFNQNKFKYLVEILQKKSYNNKVRILNTICNVTEERQSEADALSRRVDAMLIIGSSKSSNTVELGEVCRKNCTRTFLISGACDIPENELEGCRSVGITAGASTPKKIIQEVSRYVRDEL